MTIYLIFQILWGLSIKCQEIVKTGEKIPLHHGKGPPREGLAWRPTVMARVETRSRFLSLPQAFFFRFIFQVRK
jgi:hypothetical protein